MPHDGSRQASLSCRSWCTGYLNELIRGCCPFSGTRLSSTLWRATHLAFPLDAKKICELSPNEIRQTIERRRAALEQHYFRVPSVEALKALLCVIGPSRLKSLISRHTAPDHAGHSGTPDLFLYATNHTTGTPCVPRFVEVKKPGEKISDDQWAEIRFLKCLGLVRHQSF
jgi:hypothetical protein